MVNAAISTNTTSNDDITSQVCIPTINFSFGSTQDLYVYLPVSRVIQITTATYNMNLNVKAWFTGSLTIGITVQSNDTDNTSTIWMHGTNTNHPDCSIVCTNGTNGSKNTGTLGVYAGDVTLNDTSILQCVIST